MYNLFLLTVISDQFWNADGWRNHLKGFQINKLGKVFKCKWIQTRQWYVDDTMSKKTRNILQPKLHKHELVQICKLTNFSQTI